MLQAKIAMQTHSLKEKSIERSRVQDEWVAFASTLTERIQEISSLQVCRLFDFTLFHGTFQVITDEFVKKTDHSNASMKIRTDLTRL